MKLNRRKLRKMILKEIREAAYDKPMTETEMMLKQNLENYLKQREIIGFYGQDIGNGAYGHSKNPDGGIDFTLGGNIIYSIDDQAFLKYKAEGLPSLRELGLSYSHY